VIADDERDTVDLLALLIGLEGYEVHVGYDGEHALALIDRLRPPAAVIDLAMPGLNGFEIARRVRQSAAHSGMRLAAVSGWGRSDDVERALAAGFDAHFIKPADFDALMRWLGTAVAGGGRA
jgi:DNA-binding response OmpR family regulator